MLLSELLSNINMKMPHIEWKIIFFTFLEIYHQLGLNQIWNWKSNYIHCLCDAITHRRIDFNGDLVKAPLKLGDVVLSDCNYLSIAKLVAGLGKL